MKEFIMTLMGQYGDITLFFTMMLGIMALPLPDEFLLFFAGSLSNETGSNYVVLIGSAWLGSMVGMSVNYYLGRTIGLKRISKVTKWVHLTEERLTRWTQPFQKYGGVCILAGFYIAGLRHASPFIAGASRMPFKRFACYAYGGSLLWISLFIGLGIRFGQQWDRIFSVIHHPLGIIAIVIAVIVLIMKYHSHLHAKGKKSRVGKMVYPAQSHLKRELAPFEQSDLKASVRQLLNTVIPFFLLWYLAYESLTVSYWLTLALAILNSGFSMRIFIFFHDCCHHSFFKNRHANEILGTILGIVTFIPYHQWRQEHSIHHATSSNLNKRGTGDIWILTVEEYLSAPLWKRTAYRLYRNPLVMFGFGPFYLFLIAYRFNRKNAKRKERLNTYLTNAAIVAVSGLLCSAIGWQAFLMIQLPIFFVSGAVGIWLFYVQHQFEDTYFKQEDEWDYVKAALDGSSYYKLPKVLQWLTGNIGFHHIHHLSPRVPNYYLEEVHAATPALQSVNEITIGSSLQAIRFRLWDEPNSKFVGFQDIKHRLVLARYGSRNGVNAFGHEDAS
jgi:acyl-lipid omega-6 desaturase (Delta-12 desaturase)